MYYSSDEPSASHRHADHDQPELGLDPEAVAAPDLARETPEVRLWTGQWLVYLGVTLNLGRSSDSNFPTDIYSMNKSL
jgi:hypothetical protein